MAKEISRRNFLRGAAAITVASFLRDVAPSQAKEIRRQNFDSREISGIPTLGLDKAVGKEEFYSLCDQLNKEGNELRNDTFYNTFFISKSALREYEKRYGESFQDFLIRHESEFNKMLSKNELPDGNTLKFKFRRLIVLEDNADRLPIYTIQNLIKDSDGAWEINGEYKPDESDYWNSTIKIDRGLLHEIGHSTLHLPDTYSLDFGKNCYLPPELSGVPEHWKEYFTRQRSDISPDELMISGSRLNEYSFWQLARRYQGEWLHKQNHTIGEASWAFPGEIPEIVRLEFGNAFSAAEVEIYRSKELLPRKAIFDRRKELVKISSQILDSNGQVGLIQDGKVLGEVDFGGMVPAEEGLFFIKVTKNGESFCRWMDIRDLSLARWRGFEENAVLKMGLAGKKDSPGTFNWEINRSSV